MLLVAKLDSINQARIEGLIRYAPRRDFQPITFLVDTGSSQTCLLPDDVVRLGVDHASLPTVTKTIVTANGPVALKLLRNVEVDLPVVGGILENKKALIKIPLSQLPLLPPGSDYVPLPQQMVFSLLGMDVLRFFPRWTFKKGKLLMDFGENELESLRQSLKI